MLFCTPLIFQTSEQPFRRCSSFLLLLIYSILLQTKKEKRKSTMATKAIAKGRSGETFNERSKGRDVRTSNVIAAKVSK
jgi:hypothetical protein